jgi:hypothetical protein
MTTDSKPIPLYRLRVVKGSMAGQWLWTMNVSKGGAPVSDVRDWQNVESHAAEHAFHPKFLPDEGAAMGILPGIVEIFQRVLKREGIETEIVEPKAVKPKANQ